MENILEEFEGFVDKFDGEVAHFTLRSSEGEVIYGERPVAELQNLGIHERRRFRCCTVKVNSEVKIVMEPIPSQELTEEREKQIDQMLEGLLGPDSLPQEDY